MKELPYNERWLWFGILLLAGDSPFEGKICITENIGYTDEQVSELLETPIDVYKSAKEKMIKHNKIKVDKNNVILIVNWTRYQSEYSRLKVYKSRGKKGTRKSTRKSTKKDTNSSLSISSSNSSSNSSEQNNNIDIEFEEFWKFYHTIGNKGDDAGDKQVAKKEYKTLRKKESKGTVVKAANGYGEFLKHKELKEGFSQRKMYASTFLHSKRWARFLTFEYTPSL